ncbi:MAG: SpaA isopeptide-forming pilin-related protein, partial [Candidatus Faecousia sp.]|nr:SpaA isopeptide-forming pilin-related protein [Candidatus Faecousia sp.]
NESGKLTIANLPSGLYGTQYKLVEVSAPNGYIVNQTPLYFKVNNDNTITWNATSGDTNGCNNTNTGVTATTITTDPKLSITLCNELPSLIKEVKQNGGDTWKTDEQYRLDDEITYRLTVYVPKNVAELGTFEIKDVPQVGITDSESSSDYTVNYGDAANACNASLKADNYTLTKIEASGNNGQGFKLELNSTGKGLVAGKFIQIVYKAHMNANAVIAGNGNGNTATLTYSKYIGVTDTTTYAITDEARVYTYQYQITKRKDSTTGDVAGGVEFNLLYSETGTPVEVYKETDGVYRLWLTSDTDATKKTTTLATKADGTILIKGLENGTYYLKETKTIEGYNLLSAPFQIQLNVTETTTWDPGDWATNATQFTATGRTVKTYQSTSYDVTDAKGTSTIINKKGFVLPQTGGMGYLLFCTVGIVLIGGGAALIFGGRKKKIR